LQLHNTSNVTATVTTTATASAAAHNRAVGGGVGQLTLATVHGVFNSVAGVAGGVTNVAAKLSLDEDYRRKREARQVTLLLHILEPCTSTG
jgi:hypothetical protein